MDVNGRLHMPGFVGDTFEETGVAKEVAHGDLPNGNRKERRAMEAIERRLSKAKASAGTEE